MTPTPTAPAIDPTLRAALSSSARPPRASALSAALTFGWRALLKPKHLPEQLIDVISRLLDLQHALGLPPTAPAAGIKHTVGLLAEMTPPVDFIELATGRSSDCAVPRPALQQDDRQNRRVKRSRRGRPSGSTTSR